MLLYLKDAMHVCNDAASFGRAAWIHCQVGDDFDSPHIVLLIIRFCPYPCRAVRRQPVNALGLSCMPAGVRPEPDEVYLRETSVIHTGPTETQAGRRHPFSKTQ